MFLPNQSTAIPVKDNINTKDFIFSISRTWDKGKSELSRGSNSRRSVHWSDTLTCELQVDLVASEVKFTRFIMIRVLTTAGTAMSKASCVMETWISERQCKSHRYIFFCFSFKLIIVGPPSILCNRQTRRRRVSQQYIINLSPGWESHHSSALTTSDYMCNIRLCASCLFIKFLAFKPLLILLLEQLTRHSFIHLDKKFIFSYLLGL